jgi:hypothetical protein
LDAASWWGAGGGVPGSQARPGPRPDGAALDPWIRTHLRLGATILAAAPASQTMTCTVAEWEEWSGIALASSGDYVIPRGMSVLHIDHEADLGTYVEPNIWIRHL